MLPDDSNYMLYRLTWNPERNKFDKKPCRLDGSSLAAGESIPTAARAAIAVPDGCALGYWLTDSARLFFIDLDECVDPATGQLTPDAAQLAAPFVTAGCFFEASSSGRGAHIVGSYTGALPQHSNKRPTAHRYEFYTRDRGIALNMDRAVGNSAVDATGSVLTAISQWFPPRAAIQLSLPVGERRPEWRGPEDDEELIRRALTATGSAAARLSGKATFADLWNGNVEKNNESDMALASHLAFWTGCDVERIERLMLRSGLVREKWTNHRTYLRDITIAHACATTANVYQEPERKDTLVAAVGSPDSETDYYKLADETIAAINNAGTFRELMEVVVPTIPTNSFPTAHVERVAQALSKRLELFDAKLPIGQIRQLVKPPVASGTLVSNDTPPTWFAPFCYVRRTETYYNILTGTHFTTDNFRTEFSRYMPMTQTGKREDPVQWARERWNVVTVDDTMYRPDCENYFEWGGKHYANEYLPTSLPALAEPTPHCAMCIEAFQNHLYLMCNFRDDIYKLLLQWIAHNAQHPGRKIRWSPIIKGVPGDGKSIVSDLMRAALGIRNVKMTSISNLSNSGGFTDWATGAAVNFIEEIQLTGKERYKLFNAMKTYIADNFIDLNRKGRAASVESLYNVTNHWANTNYGDALPIDDGDRRWCVVFTPYSTIAEAAAAKGLPSTDSLVAHFKMLGTSMRAEPGAWRAWLMGVDTSSFDPDGRAPDTNEKLSMKLMSQDMLDQAVLDVLEQGGVGITKDAFCSKSVMGMVELRVGEKPATRTWNTLLTRLGYQQHEKMVWFGNTSHRVWTKKPLDTEKIREILEKSSTPIK